MSINLKKKLKDRLSNILESKAKVNIGKNGISSSIINEITNNLAKDEIVKIKFLKNYLTENIQDDIDYLVNQTKSKLVDKRGRTIIIYKPKTSQN